MSANKHGQRIIILFIVAAFFVSSLSLTGLVIYDMVANKDKKSQTNSAADAQKQLEEQLRQQQANKDPETKKEGALKGTKLTGFTPIDKVDSLQIIDLTPGTGVEAKAESTVTAHYTGALVKDGTIFESSLDGGQPATFPLANVIQGWQQGVPGMKEGGKRRLIIPAALAYGDSGKPPIGPNEPLVFDIELVKIEQ